MVPFLKKKNGEYPAESKWSVLKDQHDGKPMFVRRNDSAAKLVSNPEYKYRVGIAVPIQDPDKDGFPSKEEMIILNEIEDELVPALEINQLSIQVLSITTNGMREFVFYTRDPSLVEKSIINIQTKFLRYKIQFYINEDKNWELYKQFT